MNKLKFTNGENRFLKKKFVNLNNLTDNNKLTTIRTTISFIYFIAELNTQFTPPTFANER